MAILEIGPNRECIPSFGSLGQRFTTFPEARRRPTEAIFILAFTTKAGSRIALDIFTVPNENKQAKLRFSMTSRVNMLF